MSPEPIAIVGTGCRFPGGSSSPDRLWDLLRNPRNVASRVPKDRFNIDAFYHKNNSQHGATNVAESYFLDEDIKAFDAPFFNISPAEAAALDPQQRLLLETVYDSLESGGHRLDVLHGSATGVYCGFLRTDYSQLQFADPDSIPPYTVTGNSPAIMANRISYFFNWTGPSFSVDTGCSSSLLAVHLAVEALRKGDCSRAVAVGSNLILSPNAYIADAKTGMLSATGRSQMWDKAADGYARGEGVASVVLKRLSDAIAAGDEIECLIRATGTNSDGRTMGITMPNGEAQRRLIEATYASINLDPKKPRDRCQYFEAHGTGTQAGDPQEAGAIFRAFFSDTTPDDESILHVGSIKTVIGHTEATAGLAGLIKASLCLQHAEIAPNLLFHSPNPRIEPYLSHLRVPDRRIPWPTLPHGQPRRASVNSFGFGGANVHAILESYDPPPPARRKNREQRPAGLPFTISAASESSLRNVLKNLLDYLKDNPDTRLTDLALALLTRRSTHKYRLALTAASQTELEEKITVEISRHSNGQSSAILRRQPQSQSNPRLLGIFTGQGAQWPQMGVDLIKASTQAQQWMANMQHALQTLPSGYRPDFNLMTELSAPAADSRIHEAVISQPLRTAIQIIQVNLIHSLGLSFSAVVGHSSGEIVAAYAAGQLTLANAIRIAYLRGWAIQKAQDHQTPGGMIVLTVTWKQAKTICNLPQYINKVHIAAYNSPTSVTLSGDLDAIDELAWLLSSLGQTVHRLHVDMAYHSHHMRASAELYSRALEACGITAVTPDRRVLWLSSVDGGVEMKLAASEKGNEYWVANMLRSVCFSQAVTAALESPESGFDCAIEVGPHPVLRGPVSQIIEGTVKSDLPYFGLAKRGSASLEAFAAAVGELWAVLGRGPLDILKYASMFNCGASRGVVRGLPRYPFDHSQRHWAESRISRARLHAQQPPNPLLGSLLPTSGEGEQLPWLNGYKHAGEQGAILLAENSSVQLLELHNVQFHQEVPVPSDHAGLEILFCLDFQVAAIDDKLRRAVSGQFDITCGKPDARCLPARSRPPALKTTDIENFYSSLSILGHEYAGDFRLLSTLSPGGTQPALHIHPGALDHGIQTLLAVATSNVLDQATMSQYQVPSIAHLAINPTMAVTHTKKMTIDSTITSKTPDTGACIASYEACPPRLFTKTVWVPLEPDAAAGGNISCRPGAVSALMAREKLALLYLRNICKAHTRGEHMEFSPARTAFLQWATGVLQHVKSEMDPLEDVQALGLEPLRRIGQGLKDRFACSEDLPSLDTDLVDDYYAANHEDFAPWYKRLAAVVTQLALRHPEMDILEVSSTQSDTVSEHVLERIGDVYRTYTRAVLGKSTSADIKPLNLGQDLTEHPFEPHSVDLIIVHRALYATKSLPDALTTLRRLLRPGGYLLILEDTNPHLIHRKLLLDLNAWVINDPKNPSHGPVRTRVAWKTLLLHAGFSGIDSITPIHDEVMSGLSIMVSQAVDSRVNTLRNPFVRCRQHPDLVVVASGTWMDRVWLAVHQCFRRMVLVENIRDIDFGELGSKPVVVVVADASKVNPHSSVENELKHILRVFDGSSKILWATAGSNSDTSTTRSAAVTKGLLSGITVEHPDVLFQHLTLLSAKASHENIHSVATLLMHFVHVETQTSSSDCTFPFEDELRLSPSGKLHVPRELYNSPMNKRRLAAHLDTAETIALHSHTDYPVLQLTRTDIAHKLAIQLHAYQSLTITGAPAPTVKIKVRFSTASAIRLESIGYVHLLIGDTQPSVTDRHPSRRVLALSEHNSSHVRIRPSWCWDIPSSISPNQDSGFLATTVATLAARNILSQRIPDFAILCLEPDRTMLQVLRPLAVLHKTEIIAITDRLERAKVEGMVYVHRHTPAHAIRQMFPTSLFGMIIYDHAENTGSQSLHRAFPETRQIDLGSLYRPTAAVDQTAEAAPADLATALETVHGLLSTTTVTPTTHGVAELLGSSSTLDHRAVIDWTQNHGAPVKAQIQPASAGLRFSGERTYVLWDVPRYLQFAITEWLVSHGAQYIVLVRETTDSDEVEWISSIARSGAQVITVPRKGDILNTELQIRQRSFPRVNGVIYGTHLGFSTSPSLHFEQTIEAFNSLSQLYNNPDLEFFMAVDDTAVDRGAEAYATSEYLDTVTRQRVASGIPGSVLRLGPGLSTDHINRDDLGEAIAEAILSGDPSTSRDPIVTAGLSPSTNSPSCKEWETRHSKTARLSHLLAELRKKANPQSSTPETKEAAIPLHLQLKEAKTRPDAASVLREILTAHFAAYLQTRLKLPSMVSNDTMLNELGVDSLVATELGGWFFKEVGVKVSVVLLLAGSSIRDVVCHVVGKL
ncbi:ketoacyl-synt-domain-containing protein [Aspergillus crustosus]